MMLASSAFVVLAVQLGAQPPNIALIVSDDLGWNDVGFRSHQIRTPNIDKLAAEGRVLEHYYGMPQQEWWNPLFCVTLQTALVGLSLSLSLSLSLRHDPLNHAQPPCSI